MKKITSIYCDFDGTITKKDTVNTFFDMYASPKWLESEERWINGEITSRENAVMQVSLLNNVSKIQLDDFIDSIEIDDYFLDFVKYINKENIKLTILSDGFDLFIEKTLAKYNLQNIPFYANKLIYDNGQFNIDFPFYNINCKIGAGMCKCNKIKEEKFCYIGDGTSDLCVARKADLLFATKNLHKFCKKNNINHTPFDSFCNIIDVLKLKNLYFS